MKLLAGEMASILASRRGQRPRIGILIRFLLILGAMITVYAVVFKLLMLREGQEQTWITAFYWVLTVMSTLGFGDITFHTDAGRLFSMLVLLSGMLFLLVLLPFIFIEFFYQPWMEAQKTANTPRSLKPGTRGHVIVTHLDAVAANLIQRLERYKHPYVLLVDDTEEGLRLLEHGYRVVIGALDDPETYRSICAASAGLIAATGGDAENTLVASTVREVSESVRIVATADDLASIDVLALAGCQQVLHLSSMLASSLARRVSGVDHRAHVIGEYGRLVIAEANTSGTRLVGRTVRDSEVRERSGAGIVGIWQRGAYESAAPDTVLSEGTVLLLAGTREQLDAYDREFGDPQEPERSVLILGGGRVGRATAKALRQRSIEYRIVERDASRPGQDDRWVLGNAAELEILKAAGIDEATTIVITTHDDQTNVYLTLYCRNLRPSAKILSRATSPRNVSSLHRAGADFVLSYASMGGSMLFNSLDAGSVLHVAEGLTLFRVEVPPSLQGKTLIESSIRPRTGATVVAIEDRGGERVISPPADAVLSAEGRLVLIGGLEAEQSFLQHFVEEQ
ncbi:MAG TPA: NAD-binding protein [Thermoanaerobaculia bacterium]|nr:NAD-binding protein [Thermoanaerobaculia bacterium]